MGIISKLIFRLIKYVDFKLYVYKNIIRLHICTHIILYVCKYMNSTIAVTSKWEKKNHLYHSRTILLDVSRKINVMRLKKMHSVKYIE